MSKKETHQKFNFYYLLYGFTAFVIICLILLSTAWLFLMGRFFPEIAVAGTSLDFLTPLEAETKLISEISNRINQPLSFNYLPSKETQTSSIQKFQISLNNLNIEEEIKDKTRQAFEYGHSRPYFRSINLTLNPKIDQSVKSQIAAIASQVNQYPVDASLKIEGEEIIVSQSQEGLLLDEAELESRIVEFLNTGQFDQTLPLKKTAPKLSYDQALTVKDRLEEIKLSPLVLKAQNQTFTLDLYQVLSLIDLNNSKSILMGVHLDNLNFDITSLAMGNTQTTDSKITLNQQKLTEYLQSIKSQVDRDVQEPLFNVSPGSDPNEQSSSAKNPKISEFRPPLEGLSLDLNEAATRVSLALITPNKKEVELPIKITEPKNKLVNDLGIKELIGKGESNFEGSIENRIFNVRLAASRINGVLVKPGEEFSFVNTIGDISAATGYKQAYVIKSGRTVLDDGGGVCQVSTTLFRAVLNSGLPITQRTAHAYRVHYYEEGYPPGIDATIFYPSVDFKFKNDTQKSILIQAYAEGLHLTVDLYGTSDGRTVEMTKPVILSQTPPPPEIRQDDPTLPKGIVKQVDWAAWGANVQFKRKVTKGGQTIIDETFKSNFRPWQAVYLVGTKEG